MGLLNGFDDTECIKLELRSMCILFLFYCNLSHVWRSALHEPLLSDSGVHYVLNPGCTFQGNETRERGGKKRLHPSILPTVEFIPATLDIYDADCIAGSLNSVKF